MRTLKRSYLICTLRSLSKIQSIIVHAWLSMPSHSPTPVQHNWFRDQKFSDPIFTFRHVIELRAPEEMRHRSGKVVIPQTSPVLTASMILVFCLTAWFVFHWKSFFCWSVPFCNLFPILFNYFSQRIPLNYLTLSEVKLRGAKSRQGEWPTGHVSRAEIELYKLQCIHKRRCGEGEPSVVASHVFYWSFLPFEHTSRHKSLCFLKERCSRIRFSST